MYNTLDIFGNNIKAGDVIIYNVKRSTSVRTRLAVVREVIDHGDTFRSLRYELKVTSFNPRKWNGTTYEPQIYKTVLYANTNIIRMNGFTFPGKFKELLHSAPIV